MARIRLFFCFLLIIMGLSITSSFAFPLKISANGKLETIQNGVLSLTMQAAPGAGFSIPKVLILGGFHILYQNDLNWGDTWNLTIPSGNYKIMALPVSNGASFYVSNSIFVFVPPGGTVSRLITYHIA